MKVKFCVKGMTCAACVMHVEKAVKSVDGIEDVSVNLLTNSMEVEINKDEDIDLINRAVEKAGYSSYIYKEKEEKEARDNKSLKNLIVSLILLVPLFYLSMGHMMGWPLGFFKNNILTLGIVLMMLSFILMLINKRFFISGYKSVIHGSPNMDTLVALGSGVAFIYSVIILFLMSSALTKGDADGLMRYSMNLSFETAGMVPTLISIGKLLEEYSKKKTKGALDGLMSLAAKSATVIRDGVELSIDPKDMVIGDIFIVKPGEAFPADGIVLEGMSCVNEQALTGESLPVDKKVNDKVYTSTINTDGVLKCKATTVGEDTALFKIIKMVEDASVSKAPIARIADKVAGIFVPVIMGVSLVVFIGWMIFGKGYVSSLEDEMLITYALERAIAVLVIACPCALGLATPVAIMVGNGRAARCAILYKNAEALENAKDIAYAVLDKTGTITEGAFEVGQIHSSIEETELLKITASLEALSSHPLASAIVGKYNGELYEVCEFKNIPGVGICGVIDGNTYSAVNKNEAERMSAIDSDMALFIEDEAKKGRAIIVVMSNDKILGVISLQDKIKVDSKMAIEELYKLGVTPIMLTGDNYNSAAYVAQSVDIKHFKAELLPEDKLRIIEGLKNKGVAMIGDGINDAPALMASDCGIAIGAGSDVAIDSADVVLMKSSLYDAAAAIKLSRQTILNIKENLFWAFLYNLIMIPIAAGALIFAGIYMRPWYGALAMSLSSVCVVLNALRLNLYDPYKPHHYKKCEDYDLEELLEKGDDDMKKKAVILVEGMMCEKCKKHVEDACMSVPGILSANADLKKKCVTVKSKEEINVEAVKASITDAGYETK